LLILIGLLFLFLLLNFFDAKTTYFVVTNCGYHGERNPFARKLIKRYGALKGILLLKSIIIIILPLMIWSYIESSVVMTNCLIIINLFYFYVVIQNYIICKKIKKLGINKDEKSID